MPKYNLISYLPFEGLVYIFILWLQMIKLLRIQAIKEGGGCKYFKGWNYALFIIYEWSDESAIVSIPIFKKKLDISLSLQLLPFYDMSMSVIAARTQRMTSGVPKGLDVANGMWTSFSGRQTPCSLLSYPKLLLKGPHFPKWLAMWFVVECFINWCPLMPLN